MSNLATSLQKAADELKKEGHSQSLPDATAVAAAVEQALQQHFGESSHDSAPSGVPRSLDTALRSADLLY